MSDRRDRTEAMLVRHGLVRREAVEDPEGWDGGLTTARIGAFCDELEERDESRIALEAWHKAFGTTQLSHALARLEAAERKARRAQGLDSICTCTGTGAQDELDNRYCPLHGRLGEDKEGRAT